MSINITAFKCKDKIKFFNYFETIFDKFKDEAFEKLKEIYSTEVIKYAVHMYDEDYFRTEDNKIKKENSYIHLSINELLTDDNFNKRIPYRMNIGFSLVFFNESLFILMNNFNNKDLFLIFKKHFIEYLDDYSYWNNTDKPNYISKKSWEKRAETLKEIIHKDSDRSEYVGLKYNLIGKYTIINLFDYVYKQNRLDFIPSDKERVKFLAEQKLISLLIERKIKNINIDDNTRYNITISCINKVTFKRKKYINILEILEKDYLQKIDKNLSYKNLFE